MSKHYDFCSTCKKWFEIDKLTPLFHKNHETLCNGKLTYKKLNNHIKGYNNGKTL